jgi:hypothetical protein
MQNNQWKIIGDSILTETLVKLKDDYKSLASLKMNQEAPYGSVRGLVH